jgi:hypothetical protein
MIIEFYFTSCLIYSNRIGKVRPGPAASVSVHVVCDPMDLSGAATNRKVPTDVCGKRGYPGLYEIAWDVVQEGNAFVQVGCIDNSRLTHLEARGRG